MTLLGQLVKSFGSIQVRRYVEQIDPDGYELGLNFVHHVDGKRARFLGASASLSEAIAIAVSHADRGQP